MYNIQINLLPGNEDLPIPQKMSSGASGFDLHAAIKEPNIIQPGERKLIPTGMALSMPEELEAQIRPRSGLALKNGIGVLNSPGTIDSDYRGEIRVVLYNTDTEPFQIERGDRIAQLVFQQIPKIQFEVVAQLDETVRNLEGFGSTGK